MQVVSDRARKRLPGALRGADTETTTRRFYALLRREVLGGESGLNTRELAELRGHYPVMMQPERYPPELVSTIYVRRRAPAVRTILAEQSPRVLDGGCGYGSESFLFAAAGARVVAVDRSPARIDIARKRRRYYEALLSRDLDIEYAAVDLDDFDPEGDPLSLTWLGSVLANLRDQEAFLRRIARASRDGGRVLVTDMNLLNPLFALSEWHRRRSLARRSREFARHASFWRMFWRSGRRGARYFPTTPGASEARSVDDAQFFWWATLARLLRRTGLKPGRAEYSGFAQPMSGLSVLGGARLSALETFLAHRPLVSWGGYFYLMTGVKIPGGAIS